jgi:hypothetical protein
VRHQQRYDAMIGAFAEPLLSAASIEAGRPGPRHRLRQRQTARRASRGLALGVDLSSVMLDRACQDAADDALSHPASTYGTALRGGSGVIHPVRLRVFA